MDKICKNCGCYEVCFFANPYRTVDCNHGWQPIIVKCKDCKYARKSEDAFDFDGETALYECSYSNMVNRGHEYCSWGKRK